MHGIHEPSREAFHVSFCSPEEKCKQLEKKVNELLEESIMAYDRMDFKVVRTSEVPFEFLPPTAVYLLGSRESKRSRP